MNFRIACVGMVLFAFEASILAQGAPAKSEELNKLRKGYADAVERATRPLKAIYTTQLQKLLDTTTRAGKLDEALEIKAELEKVKRFGAATTAAQPAVSSPTAQTSTPAAVPAGDEFSFRAGGRDYKLLKKKVTFDEAVAYCTAQGGMVVCFNNDRERDAVKKEIGAFFPGEIPTYWLGLTRPNAAEEFKWIDGSRFEGRVANSGSGRLWVAVNSNGDTSATINNEKYHVICEMPK